MTATTISAITSRDRRFPLKPGEGSDAVHTDPTYAYAVTELHTTSGVTGIGLAFTLGGGNELVTRAIDLLAAGLVGREIESLMADFGETQRQLANHPQLRWLGPHQGVIHLALSSITNACFDLWAKSRGVPLWQLLLDLSPEELVATLDLSYLEDVLTADDAIQIIATPQATRGQRLPILDEGYPGYDTSAGWFGYSDEKIRANAARAVANGFTALKLKVGHKDPRRDIARARLVRTTVGPGIRLMVDANQQWTLPQALAICADLADLDLFWIEEPTHPNDVLAHQTLAQAIAPTRLAIGEHVANRIGFKNYLQAGAAGFIQVDCTRVAGVSEFLVVSLLARKYGVPIVPHVGDMGQIHQHLVLFNHIALDHEALFLEYIPHLREHFTDPAIVEDGRYRTPRTPGSSSDLR
ncbi:MAG TPA: enolase C-terminal domain-like protein [Thermomicrobiales bacterium]|nr:enolase C-terminal domain-like protein [Thermomicrobiales bacterium]